MRIGIEKEKWFKCIRKNGLNIGSEERGESIITANRIVHEPPEEGGSKRGNG